MTTAPQEEAALLAELRHAKAARDRLSPLARLPIGHPEKYLNPIGMDAEGELFPCAQVPGAAP